MKTNEEKCLASLRRVSSLCFRRVEHVQASIRSGANTTQTRRFSLDSKLTDSYQHYRSKHFTVRADHAMAPSLLRKKRQTQQNQPPPEGLRHSLSLPDLTTPLLDPASWEGLPVMSSLSSQATAWGTSYTSNAAQPSHTSYTSPTSHTPQAPIPWSPASPVSPDTTAPLTPHTPHVAHGAHLPALTHSPVSPPDHVQSRKTSLINPISSPIAFHRPFTPWQVVNNDTSLSKYESSGSLASPPQVDFRTSQTYWGRATDAPAQPARVGGCKRVRGKGAGRLNVVVVGPKGVGKSR